MHYELCIIDTKVDIAGAHYFLSAVHQSIYTSSLPVYSYMLAVC